MIDEMALKIKTAVVKCIKQMNDDLVKSVLRIHREGDQQFLTVKDRSFSFPIHNNCYMVGFGKAVRNMAIQVESVLGSHLQDAVISVPTEELDNIDDNSCGNNRRSVIRIMRGAKHNLPDENSEAASVQIRQLATKLNAADQLLIVVISGGGSALLVDPIPPLTVREKADAIRQLASAGADIVDLNIMRTQLSRLKGGKLARIAPPATVLSLILSDVVEDRLEYIASGPTAEPSLFTQITPHERRKIAVDILCRYNIWNSVPENVRRVLSEYQSIYDPADDLETDSFAKTTHNVIVGNNTRLLNSICDYLRSTSESEKTIFCHVLSSRVNDSVRRVASFYIELVDLINSNFHARDRNSQSLAAALACLREKFASSSSNGCNLYVRDVIDALVEQEYSLKNASSLILLFGGETTVEVTGSGRGGRNQQLALQMASELDQLRKFSSSLLNDVEILFASIATDGIDGPTDAAGAFADVNTVSFAYEEGLDAVSYLENHDSYSFFSQFDNGEHHIKIGHTGTNVMDVHCLSFQFSR